MTDNQQSEREKLAEQNRRESDDAIRLAREQEERDRLGGQKPIISSIADKIKGKLEREEFSVAVDEQGNQVAPRPLKE